MTRRWPSLIVSGSSAGAECLGESRAVGGVGGVDPLDLIGAELPDPRPVVQRLRDDLTRRPVLLQFDDVDQAVAVDREDVDPLAVGRDDLAAEYEKDVEPEDADVVLDHVLEASFVVQAR
jgi:hypothetical protein